MHTTTPVIDTRGPERYWSVGLIGLAGLSVLAFLLAPWSFQDKSIAVLHGLCAQRPSHSFWLGDARLPFDARMTGIYGGFLLSQLYLLGRGRLRSAGMPSLPIIGLLVVFVGAMGVDGFNSLLDDAGLPSLYAPSNVLRYVTGALTGTTLGVFLWLLANGVLWRPGERTREPVVRGFSDVLGILGLVFLFGLVTRSDVAFLYVPLSLVLIVAAVLVVFTLSITMVQLIRRRENTAETLSDLAKPATVALLISYAGLFAVAGGRFLAEYSLGVPVA